MTGTAEGKPPRAPEAQTRGFLFADIRGYTEYVENYGAAAATELLTRYRAAVREAIAEQRGAEIRTEGDSFYVVLPSASAAVLCALSIIKRVDADNANNQAHIRVGIGVHAGEALDTQEGLVGSAVNIAARLSALAKPGEILVSETVRTLTRSVVSVGYVERGRHRLKGVGEPMTVFRVAPESAGGVSKPAPRVTRPILATFGVFAAILAVAVAYALSGRTSVIAQPTRTPYAGPPTASVPVRSGTTSPSSGAAASFATPSGSSAPTVLQVPEGNPVTGTYAPLASGDYRFEEFRPGLTFNIDQAWTNRSWYPLYSGTDLAGLYGAGRGLRSDWRPEFGLSTGHSLVELDFIVPQVAIGNACDPGDSSNDALLGGRYQDAISWLRGNQFLATSNVQPTDVGGWNGARVDATVKGDPGFVCGGSTVPNSGKVRLFSLKPSRNFGGQYTIWDGEQARFYVIDIGANTPLMVVAKTLVPDFSNLSSSVEDLLATVTIGDGN
jgi:class 3 adenylate cyclase